MNRFRLFVTAFFLILSVSTKDGFSSGQETYEHWEKNIQAFELWDSKNSYPDDAVLFVGSSSIVMWKTRDYFPELKVINRGFGGSQIAEVSYFAERIVFPYRPKAIVFYAGDNDIAKGKTAQRVFEDYKNFVKATHTKIPQTPIIFIGIKPSLSRWKLWGEMKEANMVIKDFSAGNENLFYFDSATPLLGDDGRPKPELFKADQLHLSKEGYKLWTERLRPVIEQALKCKD
ncbi:MAG: GDSL-type esterase/lipase family protein [Planctomycetota bacterium]|jgi:lysophospholipase L1-like esterase